MRLRTSVGLTSVVTLLALGLLSDAAGAAEPDAFAPQVARVELDAAQPPTEPAIEKPAETRPDAEAVEPLTIAPAAPTVPAPVATIITDPVVADVRQRLTRLASTVNKDDRQVLQRAYAIEGAKIGRAHV